MCSVDASTASWANDYRVIDRSLTPRDPELGSRAEQLIAHFVTSIQTRLSQRAASWRDNDAGKLAKTRAAKLPRRRSVVRTAKSGLHLQTRKCSEQAGSLHLTKSATRGANTPKRWPSIAMPSAKV